MPNVPAVDIAAIGIEQHGLLVGREGPLLDFAIAGSEQARRPSFDREGVQMLPAVLF